ncbi:unnamed protein product [Strongylus vulgaris]|uniref:Dynactin subunit 4 n=1 Tax=Strongylus vulgaris TaxID=40348 RepID=A0A3P7IMF4_STRVU|nr:unnamed protein product [Strongylus vulgaris]
MVLTTRAVGETCHLMCSTCRWSTRDSDTPDQPSSINWPVQVLFHSSTFECRDVLNTGIVPLHETTLDKELNEALERMRVLAAAEKAQRDQVKLNKRRSHNVGSLLTDRYGLQAIYQKRKKTFEKPVSQTPLHLPSEEVLLGTKQKLNLKMSLRALNVHFFFDEARRLTAVMQQEFDSKTLTQAILECSGNPIRRKYIFSVGLVFGSFGGAAPNGSFSAVLNAYRRPNSISSDDVPELNLADYLEDAAEIIPPSLESHLRQPLACGRPLRPVRMPLKARRAVSDIIENLYVNSKQLNFGLYPALKPLSLTDFPLLQFCHRCKHCDHNLYVFIYFLQAPLTIFIEYFARNFVPEIRLSREVELGENQTGPVFLTIANESNSKAEVRKHRFVSYSISYH